MGTNSNIEWTDHYGFDVWGPAATTERRMMGEQYWKTPTKWNKDAAKTGVRKRVFCASMADVFEDHPQVEAARLRLFNLITATPYLDWLLLTKRPENIKAMLPADWGDGYANVWLGTSAETQKQADRRIPELSKIPAAVRFLSCEPLLGAVDLRWEWLYPLFAADDPRYYRIDGRGVDWVIVGGESGTDARPLHPEWARGLRDQCLKAGVAFFFKQWGEWMPLASADRADNYPTAKMYDTSGMRWIRTGKKSAGRVLDGRTWDEMPNGVAWE